MSKLTIRDVAREAGVSIATASYVLNNKPGKVSAATRQRVHEVAQQLGYRLNPIASQIRGASRTLLVLLPGQSMAPDLRGILMDYPFFNELLAGVEHAACDAGLQPALTRIEQLDDIRHLGNGPTPSGVLVIGKHEEALLQALEAWKAPVALVDDRDYFSRYPTSRLHDFSIDDAHLGELAAEHLLALGHTRLVLLFGTLAASSVHRERLCGVRRALSRHGLTLDADWLIETDVTLEGAASIHGKLTQQLELGATAILAMADILAIGCFKQLHADGYRVPEQVSLLGIDNLHILNYLPIRLTTVGQDVYGRGYQAVRQLQGLSTELAPIALIPGDSTASPPQKA
jgi:DNA-binding LacI/PurR family transcriptional regulator